VPDVVKGLVYDAWTSSQQGQRADAIGILDLAAELAPGDPEVLGRRAQVLSSGAGSDIAALEAAVQSRPDDLRARQELDYALSRQGDFKRIAQMWTEYLARHDHDGRAYMERAGTYHHLGRDAEAHADAAKACELGINEGCLRAR
jgi:Flp pilus assembly protein TadD